MAAPKIGTTPRTPIAPKRPKKRLKGRFAKFLAYTTLLGLIGVIAGSGIWLTARNEAEDLMPTIEAKLQEMRVPPSEILTADNHLLYKVSAQYRDTVKISEVPQRMQNAMVAAEDRRFFKHEGVDPIALVRSGFMGAKEGRFSQGGSTLTMQLAKRLHSDGEKTFKRKILDMAIAQRMEEEWTKDHILQLYLNQVYFGSGAYGIKAAADVYFGKPLSELTLGECAMLARCVRRPSDQNPFRNLDRAIANRDSVLQIMLNEGMVTEPEYEKAIKEKVHLRSKRHDLNGRPDLAPYVVTAAEAELRDKYDQVKLIDGGYKVYTTIDWTLQRAAEQAVVETVSKFKGALVNTAAFVLMDGDGRILAEVGGGDFAKNQFNVVTQGHLQPGSSFKPILYATAMALGKIDLNSMVSNERLTYVNPTSGVVWQPKNDNGKYGGMVSLRQAVAMSINVPAARTILNVGVDNVVNYGHDVFGFKSELPPYPSLALGAAQVTPLEMAQAYSVFMLRGSRATPFLISKIEGGDGSVIADNQPQLSQHVLDPQVCESIDTLLRGVVTGGTGTAAMVVPNARGKTGTTSNNKDAWFCGYANGLIGVGWVGNERYDKKLKAYTSLAMRSSVFGGTVTAGMWAKVLDAAYRKYGDRFEQKPPPTSGQTAPAAGAGASGQDSKSADPNLANQAVPAAKLNPDGSPDQANDPLAGAPTRGLPTNGSLPGEGTTPPPDPSTTQPPPDPTAVENGGNTSKPAPPEVHRKPPPVTKTDQTEYVEVEVCADTGELATDYCPETVTRRFIKGKQPRRRCHLHRG